MEEAAICIAEDKDVIAVKRNSRQTDHAAWIHTAINDMLSEAGKTIGELSAVAVTSGPGSYTGLRVGMATAKGLCYALNLPLITESTLKLLAYRAKKGIPAMGVYSLPLLICPMVDARRMEVFTAVYDMDLHEKRNAAALILDENSFKTELQGNVVIFCGTGSKKWQDICKDFNAIFPDIIQSVADLAEISSEKFKKAEFSELAYTEPAYLKNVYTGGQVR
jgi:tRNA threonylcarbamoyladenosine biosynthesis protein TsaB